MKNDPLVKLSLTLKQAILFLFITTRKTKLTPDLVSNAPMIRSAGLLSICVVYGLCIETDQLTSNRHICHLFSPFSNLNTTICSRDLARNYFSITVNCGQACRNENVIKFIFQTFLLLCLWHRGIY